MLQTQHERFVVVPEIMQDMLSDSMEHAYYRISTTNDNMKPELPSDLLIMDYVSSTMFEVASYHEFDEDFFHYLDLKGQEYRDFLNAATANYYMRFWADVLLVAKRKHLHMFVHTLGTYINQPVKEVW